MNLSRTKKIGISVFILIVIALVVVFVVRQFARQQKIKPRRGQVVESIYGLGTVNADKIFHVRAGMSLLVQKLYVSEGDLVKRGDPLVKLDESKMTSPIDGTVTAISYKDGELVTPQVSIVTVTNLEHLYLEVSLEQQLILRVKKGQTVAISFESLRNEKSEGVITSVYPRDNQFIARIDMKIWPSGVIPGMTADLAILIGQKTNVLLIPIRSILAGQVTRIHDGKKEKVAVKLGIVDGEWGEVISENILEDDELLIRK